MSKIYDLIVIGAGPAGYVAAISAAKLGLKTLCIEERKSLGGTCLNVGCIPSKALLSATELYAKLSHDGEKLGILCKELGIDFTKMQLNKDQIVDSLTKGISFLFQKYKVESLQGKATLVSAQKVEVDQKVYEAHSILLATGSFPVAYPNLPFDGKKIFSSTDALNLQKIPKKLAILGAGVIGLEIGSIYSRLGTKVELIESYDRIIASFDSSISKELERLLIKEGLSFYLSHQMVGVENEEEGLKITIQKEKEKKTIFAEALLVCIGRKANSETLGLEKVGVLLDEKKRVVVNSSFQTTVPSIFAIGDLIDGPMLAHKASEEGMAVAEMLAGKSPTIDYLAIPNVIYTDPEVASVGLTEEEVKQRKIPYKTASFPMKANPRAKSSLQDEGFIKMIEGEDRLLGVHIIAPHASELIVEPTLAIRMKKSAKELGETCHPHPTLSEAIKECAFMLEGKQVHL